MRLVNFNVGEVTTQLIDGAEVRTGYLKAPAAQPWMITAAGAEGDHVAVHPDHLYVFDRASYDFWARELAVDRSSWPDGFFAENLTVDTIDQTVLHVGDMLEVGGAQLVVTGPRVPCWKLSWRLGQPKTFIRRFRTSGRSGVYLGVRRPGAVGPGDSLTVVEQARGNPTVAEVARLGADRDLTPEDVGTVERALACPDLSLTVRMMLTLTMTDIDRRRNRRTQRWAGWRPFLVDDPVSESTGVYSFSLRPADGAALPTPEPGQHVAVRLGAEGTEPVVRTWSLSEHAEEPPRYRITVRELPGSVGVPRLLTAASAGTTVHLRAPGGSFRLDLTGFRPVVLIAAGTGISPLMAMAQAHVRRGAAAPPLWLFYGTRNATEAPLWEALARIAGDRPDVHLFSFRSRPNEDLLNRTAVLGRISAATVIQSLQGNYLRLGSGTMPAPWFETDVYICGPGQFNADIRDGLLAAGANADQVHTEQFSASYPIGASTGHADNARVRFVASGLEVDWIAAENRTLLELGEDHGLTLPSYCRSGSCHTCEARIVRGTVNGAIVTGADHRALLCSSYPASEQVWLDI